MTYRVRFFSLLVLFSFSAFNQTIEIPDANFKAYLVGNTDINTNGDGEIQLTEAQSFEGTIDCSNLNISSLAGIEHFTSINYLYCYSNPLGELNLNNNTKLKQLVCSSCNLESLHISGLTELEELNFQYNNLTTIDISSLINLNELFGTGNNLTSLDISNNAQLTFIAFSRNQINHLDLSNNLNLEDIRFNRNILSSLTLPSPFYRFKFQCYGNRLSYKDMEQFNLFDIRWYFQATNETQDSLFTRDTIFINQTIDYSAETPVNGKDVSFEWYKKVGAGEELQETNTTGLFTPTEPGEYFTKMKHEDFSSAVYLFSLATTVISNTSPTVSSPIADKNLEEDFSTFTIDLNSVFSDNESNDLTFSVSNSSGVTITIENGIATISSIGNWNGQETITFTATDGGDLSISDNFIIDISGVNDQPELLSAIPTQNLEEDFTPYTIDLSTYFEDPDGDNLLFSASNNSDIIVDFNGSIATISSTSNWFGTESVTFTATDTDDSSISTDVEFILLNSNDTPELSGQIPSQSLIEGFSPYTIDLTNYFIDPDNETLTFSVNGNSNITVDINNGVATISAKTNWFGDESVTITAIDNSGASISSNIEFAISSVNDTPYLLNDFGDYDLEQGFDPFDISLSDYFKDIDSDLTYSVNGNSNITIVIIDEVATISSTSSFLGTETINFVATDSDGESISTSTNITISKTETAVIIPNAFSPNQDGYNDYFEIRNETRQIRLSIVDRWGKTLLESDDYQNDWDGTNADGNALPDGTYFYTLIREDEIVKGYIEIKR